jgi:hypothetical protein
MQMANIFYSFTNLRARLDMLDFLVEDYVPDKVLRIEWHAIKKIVLRMYKDRNTLAHSHVWGNETGLTHLAPSIFTKKRAKSMSLLEIRAAAQSFREGAKRTTDFAISVNGLLVSR